MNSELQLSKINLTVAGIKAFIKNNQLSLVETSTLKKIITLVSENSEDSRKKLELLLVNSAEDFRRPVKNIITEAVEFTRQK